LPLSEHSIVSVNECTGSVVKWDILSFGDTEAVQC